MNDPVISVEDAVNNVVRRRQEAAAEIRAWCTVHDAPDLSDRVAELLSWLERSTEDVLRSTFPDLVGRNK